MASPYLVKAIGAAPLSLPRLGITFFRRSKARQTASSSFDLQARSCASGVCIIIRHLITPLPPQRSDHPAALLRSYFEKSVVPRIQQGNFLGVVARIPRDQGQAVRHRGGGDEAIEHGEAASLALMPVAKASPLPHHGFRRSQEAGTGPPFDARKPKFDLLAPFAGRHQFDAFDDFSKGNR